MRWKPIKKLTDADLDMGKLHNRLMLWDSCTGPYHYQYVPAQDAEDIIRDVGWENFFVLPEVT